MNTKDYILCGLFAAIMCVSAFIAIPLFFTPIPLSLQVLAVCITAVILGGKRGAIAVFIYVMLGCFGLPVFSGMKGGLGIIAGATGGYIWGFIPAVFVAGTLIEKFAVEENRRKNGIITFISLALGLAIIYFCGTIQLMKVANIGIVAALNAAVIPFIVFDLFKIVVAVVIGSRIKNHITAM